MAKFKVTKEEIAKAIESEAWDTTYFELEGELVGEITTTSIQKNGRTRLEEIVEEERDVRARIGAASFDDPLPQLPDKVPYAGNPIMTNAINNIIRYLKARE